MKNKCYYCFYAFFCHNKVKALFKLLSISDQLLICHCLDHISLYFRGKYPKYYMYICIMTDLHVRFGAPEKVSFPLLKTFN